jgi:YHS domain-containing protein
MKCCESGSHEPKPQHQSEARCGTQQNNKQIPEEKFEKKKNSSMTWMMLICILPLAILFFAGGKLFSDGYLWPIFIGFFVVAHLWMMFKGHGGHSGANTEDKIDDIPTKVSKDLVCGMRPAEGEGVDFIHKGIKYFFCSDHCRQRFEKDPEAYIAK